MNKYGVWSPNYTTDLTWTMDTSSEGGTQQKRSNGGLRSRSKVMSEANEPLLTSLTLDKGGWRERGKNGPGQLEEKSGSVQLALVCFTGIFVSYFIYGLLQEKIAKRAFGEERFHYFMFLVGFQCVANAIVARLGSWYKGEEVSLKPYRLFPILAFAYVGAMVASNSALTYISYPTQVLGKSVKPIPVLILGVLLSHKRYPAIKYLIVLLIVVGVAIFLYRDDKSRHESALLTDTPHSWRLFHFLGLGELLVFLSLTLDGFTGAIQERLRYSHKTSAYHMMFAVNVYSCVYLMASCLLSGEGVAAMAFIYRHPEVLISLFLFSLSSAVGQIFIFYTITYLGPLTCSIFTTTRKFFTILGSVLLFANPLLPRQWVGVALVFLGLGLDVVYGKALKPHPPEAEADKVKANGAPNI